MLMPVAESDPEAQACIAAFREELQQLGWAEGRNIRIDTRWGPDAESRQRSAKELVALQPDLILSQSTPNTAALLQQTRTIPIVFVQVTDPVGSGFVTSIPRPGGNVTGFITMEQTMAGKWLELLKEIAPRVNRVAFLFNPATATFAEYLSEPLQDRRCLLRRGGDRRACSEHVRARTRHCRTGTRAEWRPYRDAGYLHGGSSRGGHVARGSLPSPYHLSRTVSTPNSAPCCPTEMT